MALLSFVEVVEVPDLGVVDFGRNVVLRGRAAPAAADGDGRGGRMNLHSAVPPPPLSADRFMHSTRAQGAVNS